MIEQNGYNGHHEPTLHPTPQLEVVKHQRKETYKSLEAYRVYEGMGTSRTLEKVRQHLGKSAGYLPLLERWSFSHHWVARAKAYDEEQAKLRQRRRQTELDKMDEEHALVGRSQLLRAVALIQRHIDNEDTSLSSAVQLMKAAYDLERLARGAVTARMEGDLTISVLPKEYVNFDPGEDGIDP